MPGFRFLSIFCFHYFAGATTDQNVNVTEQDFLEALDKLTPSVSENELNRYRNIQEHFQVSGSPLKEIGKPKKQTNV